MNKPSEAICSYCDGRGWNNYSVIAGDEPLGDGDDRIPCRYCAGSGKGIDLVPVHAVREQPDGSVVVHWRSAPATFECSAGHRWRMVDEAEALLCPTCGTHVFKVQPAPEWRRFEPTDRYGRPVDDG